MKTWSIRAVLLLVVAAVVPACGGGGGGGGGIGVSGLVASMAGGNGSTGAGGSGGDFEVYGYSGSDVRVLKSGTVNVNIPKPNKVADLGDNPAIITVDTVWNVGDELALGSEVVTIAAAQCTGLHVRAGVTLTIQPNFDSIGGDTFRDRVNISFGNPVWGNDNGPMIIDGTLIIDYRDNAAPGDGLGNEPAQFYFDEGGNVIIGPNGSIVANGRNGGNGGYIYFDSNAIVSQGDISVNGANGSTNGGNGGDLDLYGYWGFWNDGTISSNGGNGAAGTGGSGGYVYLTGDYGNAYQGGDVTVNGGNGTTAAGNGGDLDIETWDGGHVVFHGDLTANGGIPTAGNLTGGSGGGLYIYAYGEARAAGSVTANGGNGSGTGNGGSGGYIEVYGDYYYDYWYGSYEDGNGIAVGVDANLAGGNGANGGSAGSVYVYKYDNGYYSGYNTAPVSVVGFTTIGMNGGNGVTGAGTGGYFYAFSGWATDYNSDDTYGGGIEVSSNVDVIGGTASAGTGGDGGYFYAETEYYRAPLSPPGAMWGKFSGNFIANGGTGTTGGGHPDGVGMWAQDSITNSGSHNCSGGDAPAAPNHAHDVEIASAGPATNSGSHTVRGGDASGGTGDDGGEYYLWGSKATHSGTVTARGGNGTTGGGWGGYVEIGSQSDGPSSVSGTINVDAGTGGGAVTSGEVWIDGILTQAPE